MMIQIRVRNNDGAFREATHGEFAEASLNRCLDIGGCSDGWPWLRDWLLSRADSPGGTPRRESRRGR